MKHLKNHISKSPWLLFGLFLCLVACGQLKREAPLGRQSIDDPDSFTGVSVGTATRMELLSKLYAPQPGMTACGFLDDMASAKTYLPGSRFRLVGEMGVDLAAPGTNAKAEKKSCARQCSPLFWGSGACKRCKAERDSDVELFSLDGRVDISASPLYHYAVLSAEIPNRERFLELVEEEIDKQSLVITPFARLYKWLLSANIVDFYNTRNEKVQGRINDAFPGSFDPTAANQTLKKSFPEAVLRNGMPTFSNLAPLPSDSRELRDRKSKDLRGILSAYSKAVPVFPLSGKWSSFQEDMERGMNLALQAFNTQNPKEQACATAIMHRGFTQLLTISGYDRQPTFDDAQREVSAYPSFEKLLDDPHGTAFRVCPIAGAFAKDGVRITLYPKDLEAFDTEHNSLDLMKTTPSSTSCGTVEAVAKNSWQYTHYLRPHVREEASGEDLINFVHGLSHWVVAFNPGATWWTQETNVIGFPMANFDDLLQITRSGGILPVQGHALSLALINVAFAKIMKSHMVMLDESMNETTNQDSAMFVRYSDKARDAGTGGTIVTNLHSSVMALETAMKFSASFARLAKWKVESRQRMQEDLAHEQDPRKQEEVRREYASFVKGMFGGDKTFKLLTDYDDESIRKKLEKVELAMGMLNTAFAKEGMDGSYTCYNQLVKDLSVLGSQEDKLGSCNPDDLRRWKRAMGQLGAIYQSPLFSKFAAAKVD